MSTGASFQDHFSERSDLYAEHRPRYPQELFDWLAEISEPRVRAWDCATGNGQVAVSLADRFDEVVATDASEQQIAAAIAHPGVSYSVAPAESSGLDAESCNLITVGQALHWFDQPAFAVETRRVAAPNAVIAAWCYELCSVSADCDAIVEGLYEGILSGFWPEERCYVEDGYRNVELPGNAISAPEFDMSVEWLVDDMLGYLRTWSACKRYEAEHGEDPVAKIAMLLTEAWGRDARRVSWPLTIRASRL